MALDVELLKRAAAVRIRPLLIDQGHLHDTTKEGYQHQVVLPKASPYLTREALAANAPDALLNALRQHFNLLSRYEFMYAKTFLRQVSHDDCSPRILALLYGPEPLAERIATFHDWARLRDLPDGGRTGLGPSVISYLLACSNPERYAFCKASVYKRAAQALLGRIEQDALKRLEHCTEFYSEALNVLRAQPGLAELRDLMHVHIAFYITDDWSNLMSPPPNEPARPAPPLNLILHGPPGTGKTYHTVRQAVETCLGSAAPTERAELIERFKELRASGHIEFVTFHQSLSYEEFVEGIRPVLTDDQGDDASELRYKLEKGIFRKVCERAQKPPAEVRRGVEVDLSRQRVWKMSLGDSRDPRFADLPDECIKQKEIRLGWGQHLDFTGCHDRGAVLARLRENRPDLNENDFEVRVVDWFKNVMAVGDLVVIPQGNLKFRAIARVTGEYRHGEGEHDQVRPVEWLWTASEPYPSDYLVQSTFSQVTLYQLRPPTLKTDILQQLLSEQPSQTPNRFVLIIDEINRGNVSKILGELITLLEEDKRLGAENELKVRLPYSRDDFGVPANLYIIGTMNTSDRSIAFLDTALRRRFRFQEMLPDPAVLRSAVGDVEGVDVAELLRVLNHRIELLYDRDHLIGHAYFMGVRTLSDLFEVFRFQIVPLLQEYFYEDWSKICQVLGCPHEAETRNPVPFLHAQLMAGSHDFEPRYRYQLNPALTQASPPLAACFGAMLE